MFGYQAVITLPHRLADRGDFCDQCRATFQSLQPRHIVERRRIKRQTMGLLIADHLQPVLDHPQPVIALAQQPCIGRIDDPGTGQRIEAGARSAQPQRGIAPAVDQLVGLGEELDLADPASPALEIKSGSWNLRPVMIGPDPRGQPPDLGNRAEIEGLAPHEWSDRGQEGVSSRKIPGAGTGANESGALPRQRGGFIMAQRGIDRDCQRADLGRRAEPQINPEDIALAVDMAHRFHQRPRHALRGLAGLVARTAG